MRNEEIIGLAKEIEKQKSKAKHQNPYNVFTAWGMSENDHTKLLLALLRYQDSVGRYPLLNCFLNRFTKGRGKMIHYQNPSDVSIRFNPRYDKDDQLSFIDGLIMFTAQGKRIAIIMENKIFDAPDQKDQIRRYITHMTTEEHIALENVWVLYVTGTGTKEIDECSYHPNNEDEATNIGRRFVTLSYCGDIIEWLKQDVLERRIYPESLTSVVRAYVESLEKDVLNEDAINTWQKNLLCKTLIGHHNVNKMTDQDFDRLYSFRDSVQEVRKEMSNNEKDTIAVCNLYGVIRDLIGDVEQKFFGEFERISTEILNNWWKREVKKLKGAQWIAKHRGLRSDKGFVQIGLSTEWGTAHLEWTPISAKRMCFGNEYQLELHIENDKALADKWREELNSNAIFLPVKKCEKVKAGTSRLLRYKCQTSKPIAKMSNKELTDFLTVVYTKELNYCCRMLVEQYGKYYQ